MYFIEGIVVFFAICFNIRTNERLIYNVPFYHTLRKSHGHNTSERCPPFFHHSDIYLLETDSSVAHVVFHWIKPIFESSFNNQKYVTRALGCFIAVIKTVSRRLMHYIEFNQNRPKCRGAQTKPTSTVGECLEHYLACHLYC